MIFETNKSSLSRRTAPHARGWQVPESPATVATRKRRLKAYSDPEYELAVYLTKGQPLERYRVLHKYEHQRLPVLKGRLTDRAYRAPKGIHADAPNPLKERTIPSRDRIIVKSEAFALEYKTDRGYSRIYPAQWISYFHFKLLTNLRRIFLGDYFYRNVVWSWFTWTCFYVQEYLYVQLSMYFPILDWFHIPFFHWPVNFELHFWRLILVIIGLVFLVFAVSQYLFNYATKLEKRLNLLHFSAFFGSILFYYLTGLAPFIGVILLSFAILLHYNFVYYVPTMVARARTTPPILLLPPPETVEYPKLPIFYYRYPFPSLPVASGKSANKRFTRFPFLTVSHRSTAPKYIFDLKRSANMLPVPWRLSRSSLFNTGKFDETFNCNPYETYERYRFERSHDPETELESPSLLKYKHNFTSDAPRDYVTLPKRFMWGPALEPLGGSNVSFFNARVSGGQRSIFRDYFTAATSRDPLRFGRTSRFVHQRLVNDPNYRLYIWLQQMAPYYHAEPLRSRFYQHFIDTKIQSPLPLPYFRLRWLLDFFYQNFIRRAADFFTLGHFRSFNRAADTPYNYYVGLLRLLTDLQTPFFYPSRAYAHASARFLANFSAWVHEDLALGPAKSMIWTNRLLRGELLVILSDLTDTVEFAYSPGSYGRSFSLPATVRFLEATGARADYLVYLLTSEPFSNPLENEEETLVDALLNSNLFNSDANLVKEYDSKHHR